MARRHEWLSKEAYGECRVMTGHAWRRTRAFGYDRGQIYASWYCERCGARKSRWYSFLTGEFTSFPVVEYPKGYILPKGVRPRYAKGYKAKLRHLYFNELRTNGKLVGLPKGVKKRGN